MDEVTLANAPLGTKAPSLRGGHWLRVKHGWQWGTGDVFPTPGGDWNGQLLLPPRTAVRDFLIGKIARPDHPATCANPNGREGFVITEVKFETENVFVQGEDTIWFGQGALLEIQLP